MTSDETMAPHLVLGRSTRWGALSDSKFLVLLAVGLSSACKGCMPATGGSAGAIDGGGAAAGFTILPAEDVRIGPENEFDPAGLRPTYVLSNGDATPQAWEATASQPWIAIDGPTSGILAPGESVEVPVDVDLERADGGDAGSAAGEVLFLDSNTRQVLGRRGVSVDSGFLELGMNQGWTDFEPSVDTREVYVSSTAGSDTNDGLSRQTPKRTLAAGVALLRHGFPDWLLLQRGCVWQESLGQWKKSGRSADEPMLVSTYGDAPDRPLLRTGNQSGIRTNGGGGSPPTIDNLAIVGIHFLADGYTGGGDCFGAQMLQPGSHLLIEDCKFEGYGTNLVFQGYGASHTDFKLRRSVIVDAYTVHSQTGAHAQGLYAYDVNGLLIEENVFDHNGWSETVPGAGADIYSHNMYIDNGNTDVVVRGNVVANGSSHGLQLRCGGTVVNNLFVRNSIALLVGGGNNPEPGGVTADVRGNVILDGKNIDGANPRGWAIVLSNLSSGRVSHNLVANNDQGTQPAIVILDGDAMGDNGPTIGVHDTHIVNNTFSNWGGGILVEGNASQITNIELAGNDVQDVVLPWPLISHSSSGTTAAIQAGDNRFFDQLAPTNNWAEIGGALHSIASWKSMVGDTTSLAQRVVYGDPDRSISAYHALLGGTASLPAYLDETRQQGSTNWRPAYLAARANRFMRFGF